MAAIARSLLVDVHTHVYLPRYASLLRSRSSVPFIRSRSDGDRLVILDNEPSGGRPVGPQYWDREEKIAFMDKHGIDVSVVSTANPWLDFLAPAEATSFAQSLNQDLEEYCSTAPILPGASQELRRLYGLGLLPIVPSASLSDVLSEVDRITQLPHLRGVILGTQGLGKGLDDPALEPVWSALAAKGLVIFLHPHYGVGTTDVWGPRDNGHVLPLALGFPFETTVATTRLILSGVLDRHPDLKILLAHSGGTLPQLSSRLASCIIHDPVVAARLEHDARWYLGKLYFDAVAYGSEELEFVSSTIGRADRHGKGSDVPSPTLESAGIERRLGSSRMLWGTDHPFFPPIEDGKASEKWMSVVENLKAVEGVTTWTEKEKSDVRGGNALSLFGLGR